MYPGLIRGIVSAPLSTRHYGSVAPYSARALPVALTKPNFLFGASTAATCIESRQPTDATLSIWDVFAMAPGRVTDGSVPAGGPDHLDHWRSDVALLADLGVNAYRFSLPWSALSSPGGLDFYDELLDALLAHHITPVVTLTHYDMPLTVMEGGGWLVPDTAHQFAEWTSQMAARFADRVHAWVTMNSPLVHTAYGYGLGIEAPGLTLLGGALQAAHHQLLGHGLAVAALRAAGATRVGIANAHTRVDPAGPQNGDAIALFDALHNRAFTDPLMGLPWPAELHELPGAPTDSFSATDGGLIAQPLDFYGVNYYHPQRIASDPANKTIPFALVEPGPDQPIDEFGWPIDATALTAVLTTLASRYPTLPPLWITENGTQDSGGLDDDHRAAFLLDHVAAIGAAIDLGVDVGGYFHWSLLDGWEFAEGLTRKFGLVSVDPVTKKRMPKRSFHAYRELLARRSR